MSGTSSTQPGLPKAVRVLLPIGVILAALVLWEVLVRVNQIPHYILPAPTLVAQTLVENFGSLAGSWWFTIKITFGALLLAASGGVLLAVMFALSRWVAASLWPFAIVLQVTPIVAIAPLILIYVESTTAALLLCAWIVAFFPVLSNTVIGLRAAEPGLRELFTLYRATPVQRLRFLLVPSSLPYFLAGLKVAGGLSLIGAIVAEFVAGTGGSSSGLASRILETGYQLQIPRMFAALVLVSGFGILIFLCLTLLSHLLLRRWHEAGR